MNNKWNQWVYKMWAPLYDGFFNGKHFHLARKRVFEHLSVPRDATILFVGIGTGSDLEFFLDKPNPIVAIDLSDDMLAQAQAKIPAGKNVKLLNMNAEELLFEDHSFDLVVASLILSVVPDDQLCMREIIRVTKPGGKVIVFDKFAPRAKALSLGKRMLRPIIKLFGTDIGRHFEEMIRNQPVVVDVDEPVLFNAMYRKIILTITKSKEQPQASPPQDVG